MRTANEPKTVAVLEAVTAGFLSSDGPSATVEQELIAEGAAMLTAVCESVVAAGGRVETIVDRRFRDRVALPASTIVHSIDANAEPPPLDAAPTYGGTNWSRTYGGLLSWKPIAERANASLMIAPESDGLLAHLLDQPHAVGSATFNCSAEFVRFAGDKWQVAQYCRQHGIPHPPTFLLGEFIADPRGSERGGSWCLKPRDGVGCVGLSRFEDAQALGDFARIGNRAADDRWIVQSWIEGVPISRGYVAEEQGLVAAAWMRQHLRIEQDTTTEGRIYSFVAGSRLEQDPGREATSTEQRLMDLLRRDFATSLSGWIGIDYVLGSDGHLTLIEINPRLTTTFAAEGNGLARARFAASLLRLADRTCR